MSIHGKLYTHNSAANTAATLRVLGDHYIVADIDNNKELSQGELSSLLFSDRIGHIDRKITLPNGAVFSTADNNSVDVLVKSIKKPSGFVHTLESSLGWVAVAICVTMVTVFSFFKWGVPYASEHIAHALPQQTNQLIAKHTLSFLDAQFFSPSQLPQEQQDRLRQHFSKTILPLGTLQNDEADYQLHFRLWEVDDTSIPNAFALPSGDIIVTDAFIQLAHTQDEIDAVLYHEIGHVVHRHSLTSLIESAFISALIILIAGDASMLADVGIGAGTLMVSSHYSRGHESQADTYAFNKMLKARVDPMAFATIMERLAAFSVDSLEKAKDNHSQTDTSVTDKKQDNTSKVLDYFSSHPKTPERIQAAKRYSACFQQGKETCEALP